MKKLISLLTVIATAAGLLGCSSSVKDTSDDKLEVYTSFYAMYSLTKEIAGDKADVYSMCPIGTEPHDYEPKTTETAKLTEADVFIYNGNGMESWAEDVAKTLKDVKIVIASDGVEKSGNDPHVWLYPMNALKEAENIKNALSEKDPANSAFYEENYGLFKEKITELDAKYRELIESSTRKEIVVAHEAYSYLCDAYGLEQIAVEGVQGSEPSPARMAEIIETMKEKGIKYICAEEMESSKTVEAIAAETGAEIEEMNPFEGDGEGEDYLEVMEDNLTILSKILN